GHLYAGRGRNAGEIGHMIVVPEGSSCVCGNRGCLERYVSLRAAYEWLGLPDPDRATPEMLDAMLKAGHPNIRKWVASAGGRLRPAIFSSHVLLAPVVLAPGGWTPPALLPLSPKTPPPLSRSVGARSTRETPRVLIGAAGRETSALGAAALPIFDEINPQFD